MMIRRLVPLFLLACAPAAAGEVTIEGRTLNVPDGFTIEKVAGPPLVDRPIVAAFDDAGRLYVADSSGTNDDVKKQLEERPHRIVRLEDRDGDGRFDRSVVFADRMMFPEGAMWFEGALYVSAPPSIWKLTDTDDDGIADHREEWFQGKTLTGCANDLHGPYPGLDGWIYWCKGAFAEQTYPRPGKPPLVTKAAHIFRARPDGTAIEPVMTGGMDNPVDVAFLPNGERFFTTTFLQSPAGGKRDGLIHAIYGGVYGKRNAVLDSHPWTSPELMPVLAHMGPAAPCGLTTYDAESFGPPYRNNLFACQFNMHKVSRHVPTPKGAGYETTSEDFVSSPDTDFHPTDVITDADGSLLVIDTGGWYKLCCPSSHFHKPDVLGAIYRVRRDGQPSQPDARGGSIAWSRTTGSELAKLLDSPLPAVSTRAIRELARRGEPSVPVLQQVIADSERTNQRLNAVWTLTRIDHPQARAAVRTALDDPNEDVRQAALQSISLHRDGEAAPRLRGLLRSAPPLNRRLAAEALGRIGDPSAVPDLLAAAGDDPIDRSLDHALTFALIEIGHPAATLAGLDAAAAGTRRAALVALDQMGEGSLQVETIARLMSAPENTIRETAAWIAGRHPEWGDALAGSLRERLAAAANLSEPDANLLEEHLGRFARSAGVQVLLANELVDQSTSSASRMLALRAMKRSGMSPKEVPDAWLTALRQTLGGDDPGLLNAAAETIQALAVPAERAGTLSPAILDAAARQPEARLALLAAVPSGPGELSAEQFQFLRSNFAPSASVAQRSTAADILSRSALTDDQLGALADDLREAGPIELTRALPAFARSRNVAIGRRLIAALEHSAGRSALRVDLVRPVLEVYGDELKPEAEELYSSLNAEIAQQKARLERALASLTPGDERRGQALFNGAKAACSVCHAIGYVGGRVGPDLTRIAQIRTDRDLLESVLFPSATLVRSYEPLLIATADGQVFNGLVQEETPESITLITGPNQDMRISRAVIDEIRPGTVSVMPAGLGDQLSPQELADLLAFLKTCK